MHNSVCLRVHSLKFRFSEKLNVKVLRIMMVKIKYQYLMQNQFFIALWHSVKPLSSRSGGHGFISQVGLKQFYLRFENSMSVRCLKMTSQL